MDEGERPLSVSHEAAAAVNDILMALDRMPDCLPSAEKHMCLAASRMLRLCPGFEAANDNLRDIMAYAIQQGGAGSGKA